MSGVYGRHPPGQIPPSPGQTPRADIPRQTPPLGRHPSPADSHCSGRYASYWNAFLLRVYFFSSQLWQLFGCQKIKHCQKNQSCSNAFSCFKIIEIQGHFSLRLCHTYTPSRLDKLYSSLPCFYLVRKIPRARLRHAQKTLFHRSDISQISEPWTFQAEIFALVALIANTCSK